MNKQDECFNIASNELVDLASFNQVEITPRLTRIAHQILWKLVRVNIRIDQSHLCCILWAISESTTIEALSLVNGISQDVLRRIIKVYSLEKFGSKNKGNDVKQELHSQVKFNSKIEDLGDQLLTITESNMINLKTSIDELPLFSTIADYYIWYCVLKLGTPTQRQIRYAFPGLFKTSISENGLMIHIRFLLDVNILVKVKKQGKANCYSALIPPKGQVFFYDNAKYNYKKAVKKKFVKEVIE